MEHFQEPSKIEQYRRRIGFEYAFVNSFGKIWIFWKSERTGSIIKDTAQYITMQFTIANKDFFITAVYARCSALERLELWEDLDSTDVGNQPWMVGGDFNVILNEDEKLGGLDLEQSEAMDFAQCINSCALLEVKFTGSKFTWWNGRINQECIFKRLDRVLVNSEFLSIFPVTEATHMIREGSDHTPIHVSANSETGNMVKPFKFQNFWCTHHGFVETVNMNWKADFLGDPFLVLHAKIKNVKRALTDWNKAVVGNIIIQKATLEDIILVKEAQLEIDPSPHNRPDLKRAEAELKRLLTMEESYWKQKAGMGWFEHGDRNTRFFHA